MNEEKFLVLSTNNYEGAPEFRGFDTEEELRKDVRAGYAKLNAKSKLLLGRQIEMPQEILDIQTEKKTAEDKRRRQFDREHERRAEQRTRTAKARLSLIFDIDEDKLG